MGLSNTARRWGPVSQLLHWAIVVLIITQFVLATLADDLPLGLHKLVLLARHKSFGITILALAIVRLAWRRLSPGPALPAGLKPWERVLAHVTHHGLYALLFVTPLTGWMMSSAKNYHVSWFNLFQLPDFVPQSEALFRLMQGTHETLAWTIAVLAVLHAGAALKHHFILKDDVLKRMLPFTSVMLAAVLLLGTSSARAASWTLDPAHSTLGFEFTQAGAKNAGRFARYQVTLSSPTAEPAGGRLEVSIDVGSLDTQDKDRDSTLRGAELFDVAKFARAAFTAARLDASGAGRLDASGTLQIRGVSRAVKLPLTIRTAIESGQTVLYLAGSTTLQRLDFGIGQGEWSSTEWVANPVTVNWSLRLVPAAAAAAAPPGSAPLAPR